jgi:hypothetical protein
MFGTIAARRAGMQNRPKLARIQMSPPPLWLMVVQSASLSTFTAVPVRVLMIQMHVDFSFFQSKFHALYKPWRLNA